MIMRAVQNIKAEADFVGLFLISAFCAVGLFNDYLCCFAAAVLSARLIYEVIKKKQLLFYINLSSSAVTVIALFYFLSVFWAIDKGEAFLGAFRFLPPLLFMLIVMQKLKEPEKYFNILPYFAVFMTIVSAVLSIIPQTEGLVEIAGRLCGFFQYSNTFALFLLVSLIVCITKEKPALSDYILSAVLLFGIFYSGSRTVFILLAISILLFLAFIKNRRIRLTVFALLITAVAAAAVVAVITDNFYGIGRFLTFSFKESTLAGRLLYYIDALPVILKHPLGMGYLGYYFTQQSFQSGVYSVMSVHNDFLQLMLDIGWVPALLFAGAIIKAFFSKEASLRKRLLLFVICAHSCFDFDLQYIAMLMLLILLLELKQGKKKAFGIKKGIAAPLISALCVLCLYFACFQTLSFFGKYEISSLMYPAKTRDNIIMLISEADTDKINEIADRIIKQNKYVSVAYSAKGRLAFSEGDISEMTEYKDKAIETAVFQYEEYLDYCTLLIHAVSLYSEAGDSNSIKFCAQKLVEVEEKLNSNKEKLSYFGAMINDQPITELSEDIHNFIAELESDFLI